MLAAQPNDNCGICGEPLAGDQILSFPSCLHVFHDVCLYEWRKRSNTCPLCRLVTPPIPGPLMVEHEDDVPPDRDVVLVDANSRLGRLANRNERFFRLQTDEAVNVPPSSAAQSSGLFRSSIASPLPWWLSWQCTNPKYATLGRLAQTKEDVRGMWVLTASIPFDGTDNASFRIKFEGAEPYIAASLLNEQEIRRSMTVDFGSDFTQFPSLHETLGWTEITFAVDMAARQCRITGNDRSIVMRNLPDMVWLACTMKAPHPASCTILPPSSVCENSPMMEEVD